MEKRNWKPNQNCFRCKHGDHSHSGELGETRGFWYCRCCGSCLERKPQSIDYIGIGGVAIIAATIISSVV